MSAGTPHRGTPHRVLVVDDDPFVRRLIELTLEGPDVDLEQARDGAEAVEAATAHPPDLVLLDVEMPRVDGIEACRQLRALDAAGHHARIVMLTGSGEGAEPAARAAGADAFLTKPFSPRALLALVDDLGLAA